MVKTIDFANFKVTGITFDDMPISFGELNLFAGNNNAGKSIVLKAAWMMSNALLTYGHMAPMNLPNLDQLFKEQLGVLFNGTFSDTQDMSGTIEVTGEYYEFNMTMLPGGVVDSFNINISDPEKMKPENLTVAMYNSKDARTFSQFDRYLKLKDKFQIETYDDDTMIEMLDFYRLYDLMWFERLIKRIEEHTSGKNSLMPGFNRGCKILATGSDTRSQPTVDSLIFDNNRAFVITNDSKVRLSTYSEGSQSVFMMSMFIGDVPSDEETTD